jgi:hypothetical protein
MSREEEERWAGVSTVLAQAQSAIREVIAGAELEQASVDSLEREVDQLFHTIHHRLAGVVEGREAERWVPEPLRPTVSILEATVRIALREAWLQGRYEAAEGGRGV